MRYHLIINDVDAGFFHTLKEAKDACKGKIAAPWRWTGELFGWMCYEDTNRYAFIEHWNQ